MTQAEKKREAEEEEFRLNMLRYASRTGEDLPAPPPEVGTVYFVGPNEGPVKIGFSTQFELRMKDLRTMNALPLEVRAIVEGPQSLEREYHKRFSTHRLHGEWFEPHPDILAEIERLNG